METTDKFDVFTYEQRYADGRCLFKEGNNTIYMFETDEGYGKHVIPDDPATVATQILYYPDTLTVSCVGEFIKEFEIQIGVWRNYDKFGEVEQEDNMDEHYPVSWKEMQGRFLANDIRFDDIRQLKRTKDRETGRYVWILVLNAPKGTMDVAHFDAETGELIKRNKSNIHNL